jgi:predicted RecB family endonuclease
MNPSIEQQIIETLRVLPEEKQLEALEFLKQKVEEEKPQKSKLMEKLEELRAKLPKDAFEGYPTDGSLNHDHYLYGSPKREVK